RNEYLWNDLNGDGLFQWGEQGELIRSRFPSITSRIDPDLKSPRTHELTLGLEHQAWRDLVVSATFIYRTVSNPVEDINLGIPYGPLAATLVLCPANRVAIKMARYYNTGTHSLIQEVDRCLQYDGWNLATKLGGNCKQRRELRRANNARC
ncbi:MAG: hypothetical protein IH951_16245, partial [Bacteroidetes bacterium]|nr:hypothetical protein [Bacteroidota bacterium]